MPSIAGSPRPTSLAACWARAPDTWRSCLSPAARGRIPPVPSGSWPFAEAPPHAGLNPPAHRYSWRLADRRRGHVSPTDPHRDPSPEVPVQPATGTGALTCRDVIGLLLDYLEVTLDPDTVAAFERHLRDCAPCRAYLRTYDRSRRLVGEVGQVEMPQELKDRLRELLLDRLRAGQP